MSLLAPIRQRLAVVVVVALAFAATGCSDAGRVTTLDRWRLGPSDATRAREVVLPTHLTSEDIPDHEAQYRLTTTVHLPRSARGTRLWFVEAELLTGTGLVVDGDEATAIVHKPWETDWVAGPQIFAIPSRATEDGVLELEWRIDHAWPISRWLDRAPELRRVGSVGRVALVRQTTGFYIATILLGALLAAAISCFAAVLVDRRDAPSAWMFATSVASVPFSLFQAGILQSLVPHRDEFAVMLLALSLACFCLGRFLARRHGLAIDTRPFKVAFTLSVVMAIVLRDRPFDSAIAQEALGSLCDMLATVPPTVALVLGQATRNEEDVPITKIVLVFGLVLSVPDMLFFLGVGDFFGGGHSVMLGVLVVVTTGVQQLARKRASDLARANEAARVHASELRAEESRLGRLSEELAAQMDAGKSRLLEAVAAISSRHRPRTNLEAGDVVDGRYRVVRRIGVGGMGTVFEVERTSDGAHFALKTAHELDGTSLARLAREALIGANVQGESIIEVVDIGIAKQGFLFLVMEFFESLPLSDRHVRFGEVDWGTRILGKVARALRVVHDAGIVHRDLKPSNVLLSLDDESEVKLADFGISRFVNEEAEKESGSRTSLRPISVPPPAMDDATEERRMVQPALPETEPFTTSPDSLPDLTIAGHVAGTVGFMAPEMIATGVPTRASDMYAFGVIAYVVLTGKRPIDPSRASSPTTRDEPIDWPDLVECVHGVDRALLETLDACRADDPRDRPTIEAAVLAFERAGR